MKILNSLNKDEEEMTLKQYLQKCRKDSSLYESSAERMVKAIGEPVLIDTAKDSKLARIFGNKLIRQYPVFSDFYGIEDTIDKIVAYFVHSAQGLEEKKQILYLMGPVGSAKSSIAERLKELMEKLPFYAIKDSPINESPLGLYDPSEAQELGIPARYLTGIMSPWMTKRLVELNKECGGDLDKIQTKIKVVKLYPSKTLRVAIAKTEPGDENNQDISSLVGKLDIRKLEFLPQNDPDAYNYSGGLCAGNRGMLEFVEMFKAPIKTLHPLLTATQEGNYNPVENMSPIPFDGVIVSHSNEAEWDSFKNNKNNEAFLDRVYIVKVPYNLRISEEMNIYRKMIKDSSLNKAPIAPQTLEVLSAFTVMSRLEKTEKADLWVKMKTYDGLFMKEQFPNAKRYEEYKADASNQEGFDGVSTRTAFKLLANVFNHDFTEVGANPVHMLFAIENQIKKDDLAKDKQNLYLANLDYIKNDYSDSLEKSIHKAYFENYAEYGQHMFDKYVYYADAWIQDKDFRDKDTGEMFNKKELDRELSKIEKPADISNPKDFRHEIVNFCLRQQAKNAGNNPSWTSYEKIKSVIEKNMFSTIEELLPVITYDTKGNAEEDVKHKKFIQGMMDEGRTEKQVRLEVDWYLRYRRKNKED